MNQLKYILSASIILVLAIFASCEKDNENVEPKNEAPICNITAPDNESSISKWGGIDITIYVADIDSKINSVILEIDTEQKIIFTEKPYKYVWDADSKDFGDYIIKATAYDEDENITTHSITINLTGGKPLACFSYSKTNILQKHTVQFTDTSKYTPPTSWLWNFGDGTTSTDQNPLHKYNATGIYTVQLTATNEYGSNTITKSNLVSVADTFVKDYDGNYYDVVPIGEQIWMAENLKTTHYADGTSLVDGTGVGSIEGDYTTKYQFAYDDDPSNAEIYGRLYTWAAVMNNEASSNTNPSNVQGVCPDNWHVPSRAEWDELGDFVGGEESAGGMLKETSYNFWMYPNTAASNESGFNVLPAGIRNFTSFINIGYNANYWASTATYSKKAHKLKFFHDDSKIEFSDLPYKNTGHSIRCVKD